MTAVAEPRAPRTPAQSRRALLGLAALFFAPLALAFLAYYGSGGWHPSGHVNRGTLIDPARPTPPLVLPEVTPREGLTSADFLTHKWTILYVGSGACDAVCRRQLYETRQVRTALNRNESRVQRVFLATGECCDRAFLEHEHPDLITVRATDAATPLLALLPEAAGVPVSGADRVYLIDPLGNLMMWYAPAANPKGMLEDLKRVLGLSHVG